MYSIKEKGKEITSKSKQTIAGESKNVLRQRINSMR